MSLWLRNARHSRLLTRQDKIEGTNERLYYVHHIYTAENRLEPRRLRVAQIWCLWISVQTNSSHNPKDFYIGDSKLRRSLSNLKNTRILKTSFKEINSNWYITWNSLFFSKNRQWESRGVRVKVNQNIAFSGRKITRGAKLFEKIDCDVLCIWRIKSTALKNTKKTRRHHNTQS
jgi:hypothetical protein